MDTAIWKSWNTNVNVYVLSLGWFSPWLCMQFWKKTAKSNFFKENKVFHINIIKLQVQMQPKAWAFFSSAAKTQLSRLICSHILLLCWHPIINKCWKWISSFLVYVPQPKIFLFPYGCKFIQILSFDLYVWNVQSPYYKMLW